MSRPGLARIKMPNVGRRTRRSWHLVWPLALLASALAGPPELQSTSGRLVLISGASPAHAGGRKEKDGLGTEEREREREKQREDAKRERENWEHEREREREEAKKLSESSKDDGESSLKEPRSGDENSAPGRDEDDKGRSSDEDDRSGASREHSSDDDEHEDGHDDEDGRRPPSTVKETFERLFASGPAKVRTKDHRAGRGRDVAGEDHLLDAVRVPDRGVLTINPQGKTLATAKAKGFTVHEATRLPGLKFSVTRITPPEGMSLAEAERILRSEAPGTRLGLNLKYRIYRAATGTEHNGTASRDSKLSPRSCDADHCFGREIIGWQKKLKSCAKNIRIGVVDTAVDTAHPAFLQRRIAVRSFSSQMSAKSATWHGTGVLALLAGDEKSGTPGLVSDAEFIVADAFYSDEDGQPSSDTLSLLRALDWLKEKQVKIINMSIAGPPDDLLRSTIEEMSVSGTLFIAAAGNEGPGAPPSYPAAYPQVIAVTAVDKHLHAYRYANQGGYIDVAAPGVSIWTAIPGAQGGYHSGTSFAAPFVTAAIAAIYDSLPEKSKTGALERVPVVDIGEPGRDPIFGHGLIIAPDSCSAHQIASTDHKATVGSLGGSNLGAAGSRTEILPWQASAGFAP